MICSKGWVRDFSRGYEPTLFLLIFILGTVGNLLVVLLYTGIRNRLKTMTDMYLLNLAVADLLFLATLPFWAVNALQGWAFGRHATGLCKAVVVVYKLNFFSSMLLLACISVDRYVAIVQVTRAHNLRRERRMLYSRVACLGVWLLSCLLAVPEVLFAKVPVRFVPQFVRLPLQKGFWSNGVELQLIVLEFLVQRGHAEWEGQQKGPGRTPTALDKCVNRFKNQTCVAWQH